MPITSEEIQKRFTYHAPRPGQPEIYETIREHARRFAAAIVALTSESREQSLAMTHLEEAVFWANASVARNGTGREWTDPNTLYPDVLTTEHQSEASSSPEKED